MYAMLAIDRYLANPACRMTQDKLAALMVTMQSEEGWFQEYDGMDAGYLSQTIYYLARCHEITGDEHLLSQIRKAIQFFAHFIHPDGSCGGVYGS